MAPTPRLFAWTRRPIVPSVSRTYRPLLPRVRRSHLNSPIKENRGVEGRDGEKVKKRRTLPQLINWFGWILRAGWSLLQRRWGVSRVASLTPRSSAAGVFAQPITSPRTDEPLREFEKVTSSHVRLRIKLNQKCSQIKMNSPSAVRWVPADFALRCANAVRR